MPPVNGSDVSSEPLIFSPARLPGRLARVVFLGIFGTAAGDQLSGPYASSMSFERPAPDLNKMIAAWETWEKGEENPGRVLANLKTAGLAEVLAELKAQGWTPSAK